MKQVLQNCEGFWGNRGIFVVYRLVQLISAVEITYKGYSIKRVILLHSF